MPRHTIDFGMIRAIPTPWRDAMNGGSATVAFAPRSG